jgi:hypothetical protein
MQQQTQLKPGKAVRLYLPNCSMIWTLDWSVERGGGEGIIATGAGVENDVAHERRRKRTVQDIDPTYPRRRSTGYPWLIGVVSGFEEIKTSGESCDLNMQARISWINWVDLFLKNITAIRTR